MPDTLDSSPRPEPPSSHSRSSDDGIVNCLGIIELQRLEVSRFVFAFAWFFCVLGSYYMIRPIRETMATVVDRNLRANLFLGTFVVSLLAVPLFGWCAGWLRRRSLVPVVYRFFSVWLIGFAIFFAIREPTTPVAGIFYVWVSVFNLFVVSVFWSVLADEFASDQGKRLFGAIAAGGSIGGMIGSLIIPELIRTFGIGWSLLVPFIGLELALLFHDLFERSTESRGQDALSNTGGDPGPESSRKRSASGENAIAEPPSHIFSGLVRCFTSPYLGAICLFLLCGKWCATAVYLLYVESVNQNVAELSERTAVFAQENLYVQILTIIFQLVLSAQILKRLGMPLALGMVPVGLAGGFMLIGWQFGLWQLFTVQVLNRGLSYGLLSPSSQNLFTVVPRQDKYKTKNTIDTVVFRGGDVASAWVHKGMSSFLPDARIALVMAPVALIWGVLGAYLGRQYGKRTEGK